MNLDGAAHTETQNSSIRSGDETSTRPLFSRARELAATHQTARQRGEAHQPFQRLRSQGELLQSAYQLFATASEKDFARSYAIEWFLDNFRAIQQALRQIRKDMPRDYYHQLPKLSGTELEGHARVYAVALDIIRLCNAHLKIGPVKEFVEIYQETRTLTIGETWALPTMLRMGVLDYLSSAIAQLARLRLPEDHVIPTVAMDEKIDVDDLVANCVMSLRFLENCDWKDFFEQVNPTEHILRSDPLNAYASMDFDTRDRYRKVVEALAVSSQRSETEVAGAAIRLARSKDAQKDQEPQRESHVGYYLMDAGRKLLENSLSYRSPWSIRLRRRLTNHPVLIYLAAIGTVSAVLVFILLIYARSGGAALVQMFFIFLLVCAPIAVIAVGLVNWVFTHLLDPRILPKMDFSSGIPPDCRTMVVIPALLTNIEELQSLLQQLELHFLNNSDPNLSFALLTDFADASQERLPQDGPLLRQAMVGIDKLNQKYRQAPAPDACVRSAFYLFHRRRKWNAGEQVWMGWERKRGKLEELNRLLLGADDTSFITQAGNPGIPGKITYVITLDADTLLPRDSAHRLIGTLAHPLNRARIDPETGRVTAGYTVLQPRMEIRPASANRSLFTRLFAGDTAMDLYTLAVSNVYQDLLGEGLYVGKGIYDVVAFDNCMNHRVPDNSLLSHDLIEGLHMRVALVSDIVLMEDYPPSYLAYTHRQDRWIRGDWQLLPWLSFRVPHNVYGSVPNPLSLFARWKIVDNLMRSLFAPALTALLISAWFGLFGSAWVWTLFALAASAMPILTGVASGLIYRVKSRSLDGPNVSLRVQALRWLLNITFLPHEAATALNAILRTIFRLAVTRKRLLQWTTAAHAVKLFGGKHELLITWYQMGLAPLLTVIVALSVGAVHFSTFLVASPILSAWFISPQIAYWISRATVRAHKPLLHGQRYLIRRLARRTWFYFEQFVGPDDHWLPPDHFQESPRGSVAHRTSPTNIGLLLLSTLGAYDLGYIDLDALSQRLRSVFNTLHRMERYQGHFLNWYDTRTLGALPARYVSTVDSGNLAMCLLAVKEGCLAACRAPAVRQRVWQGLLDTIDVLDEVVQGFDPTASKRIAPVAEQWAHIRDHVVEVMEDPGKWASLLIRLHEEDRPELDRRLIELINNNRNLLDAPAFKNLRRWTERVHHQLLSAQRVLNELVPWMVMLHNPPELFKRTEENSSLPESWQHLLNSLPALLPLDRTHEVCESARQALSDLQTRLQNNGNRNPLQKPALEWCEQLNGALDAAQANALRLLDEYTVLSDQAQNYADSMEFAFLFDSQRQLFHIGYNVDTEQLDASYYDLLSSEARIASLVAIAKGDVPQRHWLHLARPMALVDGTRGLLSWSGSMFEYLMPILFLKDAENSLLEQSNRAAVNSQIAYGRKKGVPWGISESAYYQFDAGKSYQYRAFGVPELGLKRGLEDELVVAPYASLLALPLQPQAVMKNIERLIDMGMLGDYGFYEAVDYTASRLTLDQKYATVQSFYSHHQGMIFISLANYLLDNLIPNRLHANTLIQSAELLLHERIPLKAPVERLPDEQVTTGPKAEAETWVTPWSVPVEAPFPQVHYLSNGNYGVLITSAGSGFSRWRDVALTRWRADSTLDNWGTWIYVQDRESGRLRSAGYQPVAESKKDCAVLFSAHKAEFSSQSDALWQYMEVVVPPEDDLEIRRIALINRGGQIRKLRITSYAEAVLAPQDADRSHPAFNKLFIQSEYLPDLNALLFYRRVRSSQERPLYLAHVLLTEPPLAVTGAFESDRGRFVGRGRSTRNPGALRADDRWLSNSAGATLDPIMALGQEVDLEAKASVRMAYITLVAESRQEALDLAARYSEWSAVDLAFDQSRSRCELELRQLNLKTQELERVQQVLSLLLYPNRAYRADPATLSANRMGQRDLWRFGISGDNPVLLARIASEEELSLVQELLRAHVYWRKRHLKIDLVILNTRDSGYSRQVQEKLHRLLTQTDSEAWLNQRGGVFILQAEQMSEAERVLLETAARVVFDGQKGSLGDQLKGVRGLPAYLPAFAPTLDIKDLPHTAPIGRPADLDFENGLGGFGSAGKEYLIYLAPDHWPPAPWINVIANPEFGFLVSEGGLVNTWAFNSGENRLTPWHNDPVSDPPAEAIYIRDEETAHVWSPTPLPAGAQTPYLIRHGAGYSSFEHHSHGLKQQLFLFGVSDAPVKIARLRFENTRRRVRRLTVTYYAEWQLGASRDDMQQYIVPDYSAQKHALLARNPYNSEFAMHVAFLAADREPHGLTTDRTEFLGRMGSPADPAGLKRIGLSGTVRPGIDPCAAIQIHMNLNLDESQEIYFLLGEGLDREHALELIERFGKPDKIRPARVKATSFWDDFLNTVQVETPDPAMNILLNRWLPYQNLSCRIWGRTAFYQSSGAYGFRDQLQDVMALLHAAPKAAREHILRAARHQFEAGDVLHWFHPPSGRGVRTRVSDDLLWLPFAAAHYVTTTDDQSILTEKLPFLKGDLLKPEEEERYGLFEATSAAYTLYEHCVRAVTRGSTSGPHGLPLIGAGDWNDGMNRVGIAGRGESIWLGWFLYAVLTNFAPICERMGDSKSSTKYRKQADTLRQALESHGWDGEWYLRAYYDDGLPLGSARNAECRIDSIAQSWSVLSEAGDAERSARAMRAVSERLVSHENQLIRLFAPPFSQTLKDPGYIKGYPPGIRENGGQYTHAALWSVWAFAKLGQGDLAEQLFRLLNPIYHSDTPEKMRRYRVEPYVVAADVYGAMPHTGHGGWTWYTGSAGWMYRLGLEAILGVQRLGTILRIDPCIPKHWKNYSLTYRYGRTVYEIHVENPNALNRGVKSILLNGELMPNTEIALMNDHKTHTVQVQMGSP
jgi:cyclic beta-1,2-glucan synthetase